MLVQKRGFSKEAHILEDDGDVDNISSRRRQSAMCSTMLTSCSTSMMLSKSNTLYYYYYYYHHTGKPLGILFGFRRPLLILKILLSHPTLYIYVTEKAKTPIAHVDI